MSVPIRLTLFAVLLAVVFGGAALAGGAIDPDGAKDDAGHAAAQSDVGHGDQGADADADAAHGAGEADAEHAGEATTQATALPGLAVAQDGYRMVLDGEGTPRAGRTRLAFRIVGQDGDVVRTFDVAHAKRLHLIVVRRDLEGFQHLHPEMAGDGTWSTDVDLPDGGTYRVFADFTIDGVQRTLGSDLQVPGAFTPRAVPAVSTTATDDRGLQVRRRDTGDGTVAFDVLRDGRVVNGELEDYLGAKGHLVTLRVGDLAYLHTHPDGDRLSFGVELPTPGAYRSWVQFQLDGVVHTAAFTQEVAS